MAERTRIIVVVLLAEMMLISMLAIPFAGIAEGVVSDNPAIFGDAPIDTIRSMGEDPFSGSRVTFATVPTGTTTSIADLDIDGNNATDVVVLDGALWIMFRNSDQSEVAAYHPTSSGSSWNISFEAYAPKTGSAYIGMDPGRFGLRATIRNGSAEIAGLELAVGNATSQGIYSLEGSNWELARHGIAPAFPGGNESQGEKADRYIVSFEWKGGSITAMVRHTVLGILLVRSFAAPMADATIHIASDSELHRWGTAPDVRNVNGGWMVDDLTIRAPDSSYPTLPLLWAQAPLSEPVRIKMIDEQGTPLPAQVSIAGTAAALNGTYYEAWCPRTVDWNVETVIDVDTGSMVFRDGVRITTTSSAQGARIADWWGGWDWASVFGTDDCKDFATAMNIYDGYDHPLTAYIQYIAKPKSSSDILATQSELGMHLPHDYLKWKNMNWSEAVTAANISHSLMDGCYAFASRWDDPSYVGVGDTYISLANPGSAATYQAMFAQYLQGTRIAGISSNYMDTVPGNSSLYGSWWSPDSVWWTTPGHSWQPSRPEDMMDAMRPWNTDSSMAPWSEVRSIASRSGLLRVYNHQSPSPNAVGLLNWVVDPKNNFSFENWKATDGEAASYVYAIHTTSISNNLSSGPMVFDVDRKDPQAAGYWLVPVTASIDLTGWHVSQVCVVEHTADGDVARYLQPLAGKRTMDRGYDIRNGTLYVSDFFNGSATIFVTGLNVSITEPTADPAYSTMSATIDLGGDATEANGMYEITSIEWTNAATGSNGTAAFTANVSTSWNISGIALAYGDNAITVTARDAAGDAVSGSLIVTRYSPHGPIYISGNAQFSSIAASEGWAGDGSAGDPYVIRGYYIDSSSINGIQIKSSDVHFTICDVYVNSTSHLKMGISLTNVANGSIRYAIISDNLHGIYASATRDLAIDACSVSSNAVNGMHIVSCSNVSISDCDVRSNDNNGVHLASCTGITMVDTNSTSNVWNGLYLQSSNNSSFCGNGFISNVKYGAYLSIGSGNTIWNNTFTGNNGAGKQALNAGTANRWNSSSGYGNYWSDWKAPDVVAPFGIVDLPYNIFGSAGAKDYCPRTTLQAHQTIYINGNSQFAQRASLEGWAGNGSADNPYVLGGYYIDSGSANGIQIKNTDAHFIIRNVRLGSTNHAYKGISLTNVNNGGIQYAICVDGLYGIQASGCNYLEIVSCNVSSNAKNGIYVVSCGNITISDCEIYSNGNHGIHLGSCQNLNVSGCAASLNSWHGVYARLCGNLTICGSRANSNGIYGIYLSGCTAPMINGAGGGTASSNLRSGIMVADCIGVLITQMTIRSNNWYGVHEIGSMGVAVTGCDISDNRSGPIYV